MKTNSTEFLKNQYKDSSNLDIRIRLHEAYSTNPIDWHEWVFDQMDFKKDSRIIEFGCGTASLWEKNARKMSSKWRITLTDMSEGMLAKARHNTRNAYNVAYQVMDIQNVESEDGLFDVVIANHMLYHVPDIHKALAEVQRVLRDDGVFYAATNGGTHLREIFDFVAEFDPSVPFTKPMNATFFGLENGEERLRGHFGDVQLVRYPSDLRVTSAQDLADFIFSIGTEFKTDLIEKGTYASFILFLESKKNEQGHIHISKDSGVFVCRK
jgi:SAM-dependent methyltransferase